MLVFDYVLILLAAVLLSNLINRFLPMLSVPIVQILLGVLIALVPFGPFVLAIEFFEPELFFVLFISPLIFHTSVRANKKTLWELRTPIAGTSVLLVLITVAVGGFFIHAMIPFIPYAAGFALIAALGPTDAVAVEAVAKRISVPRKVMGILSGESIINDATGMVCFQFAVAAVVTGSFSILIAAEQFLWMGLGGLLIGLILAGLKYLFVSWLDSLGIENITLHILIDILTPFIIFMIAEAFSVSGILSAFSAGIALSVLRDRLNPEAINLHMAQDNVWDMLSYTLDGLVFVMLGTQFPEILETIRHDEFPIDVWHALVYTLVLMALILLLRFLWWIVAIRKKAYQEPEVPVGRIKAGIIFSLSGARGTVSLAGVMSIPLLLPGGGLFPERALILLLASGVIIVSLLLTNFVLPLFVEQKTQKTRSEADQSAYAEISHRTAGRLILEANDENRMATGIVVRSYSKRTFAPKGREVALRETKAERDLLVQTLLWKRDNTLAMLREGKVDENTAEHVLANIDDRLKTFTYEKEYGIAWRFMWFAGYLRRKWHHMEYPPDQANMMALNTANVDYVLKRLKKIRRSENSTEIDALVAIYDLLAASRLGRAKKKKRKAALSNGMSAHIYMRAMRGFQIERELIQEMFEEGRISRETVHEMRGNLAFLEERLKQQGGFDED